MPRPRTGRLRVKQTTRGRSFSVRFKIGPQEHFVQIGGEWEGWTEEQALAHMQVLMRQVDRGEWKPPEPTSTPAEPEPTFQVFASIWLDRRQRRLAPKSVKQYEWALGASSRLLRRRPAVADLGRADRQVRRRQAP